MKTNHIWVVEAKDDDMKRWWPTYNIGHEKAEANVALMEARSRGAFGRFRLTKYVAVAPPARKARRRKRG